LVDKAHQVSHSLSFPSPWRWKASYDCIVATGFTMAFHRNFTIEQGKGTCLCDTLILVS
jgi:hypothetical protein